ncbi:MAG: hypothetical protein AAGK32_12040, partial [Actinomycetota bacterium]
LAKDIALQATGLTIAAGTGGYAAPEQMTHGGDPSRQTDLYATTAVMYRILTGTNPPNYDLLKETVPFPDGQWWMAAGLGQFFRRGMAYDQTARHQSIDGWLAEFRQAYGGEQTALPPTTPAVPPASTPVVADSTPRSAFPSVPEATPDRDPTSLLPQQQPTRHPSSPAVDHRAYQPSPSPQAPPQSYQAPPNQGWPPSAGPDPRSMPAVSAPVGVPPAYQQPIPSQPGYGHYPTQQGPFQPAVRRRSKMPWLISFLVLAAAAAVAGYFLVLPALATPDVTGPTQARAGELAEYTASFEGADGFRWTFGGEVTDGPDFSLRGIVPGPVSFEVQAIEGSTLSRARTFTVDITEGEGAPVIIGPSEITVGEPTDFRFEAEGATDPEWRIDQVQNSEQITVTGSAAGPIEIILIVTNADGDRVGTRRTIQVVSFGNAVAVHVAGPDPQRFAQPRGSVARTFRSLLRRHWPPLRLRRLQTRTTQLRSVHISRLIKSLFGYLGFSLDLNGRNRNT